MEKFIAKNEEVLTRVILEVDENRFIVETPYSDSSTLELSMQCVESAVEFYKVPKESLSDAIKGLTVKNELLTIKKIRFTMEQFDKRYMVEIGSSVNFIKDLLRCLKSCAILATWQPETINNFLEEYATVLD